MEEETIGLEEVVAVGYGTQKKVNLTGSVNTIDSESLQNRPVQNATQMLQGLAPGLNVTQAMGGELNETPQINIRGIATIGVGSTGNPLILIDGMEGNINAINPQDIESISILKDAAASSIYGSRAPFGVILVTTKRGSKDKTVINYNNSFRLNSPVLMPRMADSYSFALFLNDASINSGTGPRFDDTRLQRIKDFQEGKIKETMVPFYKTQLTGMVPQEEMIILIGLKRYIATRFLSQEHNLSFSGGNDRIRFYTSGNFLDQNGFMEFNQDEFNRFAFSLMLDATLNNWASINMKNRFIREEYGRPSFLNSSLFNTMARRGWPTTPLYDPNGYLFHSPSAALNLRDGGRFKSQKDWLYQQLQLVLEPIKGWKTFAEFNYRTTNDFNHENRQVTYNHDVAGNPYPANQVSYISESASRVNFLNANLYSEYEMSISNIHNFKFWRELNQK
jgi:TonB-dependent SusC/RagA subfamily outer membrane receptor